MARRYTYEGVVSIKSRFGWPIYIRPLNESDIPPTVVQPGYGMKDQTVKKLSEIVRVTNEWSQEQERGLYCYRGQSEKGWGLVPTVFRHLAEKYDEALNPEISPDDIATATEIEIRIYEEFRERTRAYKHERVDVKNPWEMLCLAQHFGVPTRLLDWTSNPLVAAYFAVEDLDDKRDGVIWCLNAPKFLGEEQNKHLVMRGHLLDTLPHPGSDEQVHVDIHVTFLRKWWLEHLPIDVPPRKNESIFTLIQPPDIDDRMKIQSGLFTAYISVGKTKEADFVWSHSQWLEEKNPNTLRKLTIPGSCKHEFLVQLWRMGISHNALFPGLSGLGQHLVTLQKEWLKRP